MRWNEQILRFSNITRNATNQMFLVQLSSNQKVYSPKQQLKANLVDFWSLETDLELNVVQNGVYLEGENLGKGRANTFPEVKSVS